MRALSLSAIPLWFARRDEPAERAKTPRARPRATQPHAAQSSADPHDADASLLDAIAHGDADALGVLFEKYAGALLAYGQSIVADTATAEDVVQNVFLRIWQRRAEGIVPGRVAFYLYGAVRNGMTDAVRRERRIEHAHTTLVTDTAAASAMDTGSIEAQELAVIVGRSVARLPARCREVFELSRYRHLSQRDIAETLGITLNTVNTQLARALHAIRDAVTAFQCAEPSPMAPDIPPKKKS
jgi:RNA polymerase sigma-70 factor (ECF subfamily)